MQKTLIQLLFRIFQILALIFVLSIGSFNLNAQFNLNGNAVSLGGGCYRLTQAFNSQVGTAWAPALISLNNPFDLQFDIYLGCNNNGADGLVFGLQSVSTSAGGGGSGIGYGGITPSIGVEFDTYQNGFDPAFDHCAILKNGNVNHSTTNTLAGPVQINPNNANVEDCNYHRIRITWDPVTQKMEVYYGCTLRLSHTFTSNVVTSVFGGNPNVYWGFTAATGGYNNEHRFCIVSNPFQSTTQADSICAGDSVQLTFSGATTYQWNTSAGISDSTIGNPFFSPTSTDTFSLTLTDSCGNSWNDTAIIFVQPDFNIDLGNDTLLCPGATMTLSTGLTNIGAYNFKWQNNTIADSLVPTTSGEYKVTVSDTNGICTQKDSMKLVIMPSLNLNLGNDTTLCNGTSMVLNITQDSAYYLWSNGNTTGTITVDTAGLVWAMKYNVCDTLRDSINFDSVPIIQLELGNDTTLCNGQAIILDASNSSANYLWSTTSTDSAINVSTPGSYSVTVTTICQTESDSITITFTSPPIATLPPDQLLCAGDSILLTTAADTGISWWSGNSNDSIYIHLPGQYHLTLSNICGSSRDTINITGLNSPQINLGPDTTECSNQSVTFNAYFDSATYAWSNGATTSQITTNQQGTYIVTVTNTCGSFVDSVKLYVNLPPSIQLPNDTSLCPGEELWVYPQLQWADTIEWSNGNVDTNLLVTQSGTYKLTVKNACGFSTDQIKVGYYPQTTVELGPDSSGCKGDTVTIDISNSTYQYAWSHGPQTGQVDLKIPGLYSVTVTDKNGCKASDSINLPLNCPWEFYMPNAFSPNNDGINDKIGPKGYNLFGFNYYVFDRWGNQLFHTFYIDDHWDGTFQGELCKQDVYTWKVYFYSADGKVYEKFGSFLLITRM